MIAMKRIHLIVHGRVQGVGFRFYTQKAARKLGILGWVKNRSDATVEIDAQGNAKMLEQFLKAVRKGSPASKVDRIQIEQRKPTSFHTFEIRYD
ncbi:acylphosphatase [Desmospora sp. 8437]|nr:acylphosphatase [Desmospora sp. 8437]